MVCAVVSPSSVYENMRFVVSPDLSSTTQARMGVLALMVAERRRWKIIDPSPNVAPLCHTQVSSHQIVHTCR